MIRDEYNVEMETDFNREQLGTTIPERVQELIDVVDSKKARLEAWYADLLLKILLSVARVCGDLHQTIGQDSLPAAAWNARNLLELWIWVEYCSASLDNARRFHEDALRDMLGMVDLHSKMCEAAGVDDKYSVSAREGIGRLAIDKLGLQSITSNFTKVSEAAQSLGMGEKFGPSNAFLSKLAHPTAGLVVGILHQPEFLRGLQCTCTTQGLYYAGECVTTLGRVILAI